MKTTSLLIKKSIFVALLFSVYSILAQKSETPHTTYDLNSKINEMTLTVGGVLVVATNDGLVGIRPTQKEPVFTFNNFGQLKPEEKTNDLATAAQQT